MNKLPDTLYELIDVAQRDIYSVLDKPTLYKLDMTDWVKSDTKGAVPICAVCLAGAVMVESLGVVGDKDIRELSPDTLNKLRALNDFRKGDMSRAAKRIWDASPLNKVEEIEAFTRRIRGYPTTSIPLYDASRKDMDAFFSHASVVKCRELLKELDL